MFDEASEVLNMVAEDENLLPNTAKIFKRLYDELIEVGFNPEQAITIVSNYNTNS